MSTQSDDANDDSPDPNSGDWPAFPELSDRQRRALALELEGQLDDREIAEEVGVHRSTLYRWRKQLEYKRAKHLLLRDRLKRRRNRMAEIDRMALNQVADAIKDGDAELSFRWLNDSGLLGERPEQGRVRPLRLRTQKKLEAVYTLLRSGLGEIYAEAVLTAIRDVEEGSEQRPSSAGEESPGGRGQSLRERIFEEEERREAGDDE